MSDSDPKETLQEFREYFAGVYEARHTLVARIGKAISLSSMCLPTTGNRWLERWPSREPFLDAEAKRNADGNGIRATDPAPMKFRIRSR
jgi:hypothetical protein